MGGGLNTTIYMNQYQADLMLNKTFLSHSNSSYCAKPLYDTCHTFLVSIRQIVVTQAPDNSGGVMRRHH